MIRDLNNILNNIDTVIAYEQNTLNLLLNLFSLVCFDLLNICFGMSKVYSRVGFYFLQTTLKGN